MSNLSNLILICWKSPTMCPTMSGMIDYCPTCGHARIPDDSKATRRVTHWLTKKIARSDLTHRQLSQAINSRDRGHLQAAIADAVASGDITFDADTGCFVRPK